MAGLGVCKFVSNVREVIFSTCVIAYFIFYEFGLYPRNNNPRFFYKLKFIFSSGNLLFAYSEVNTYCTETKGNY